MAEMIGKIEIDPVYTKDGTILELVDRLVATNNRATLAESKLEMMAADLAIANVNLEDCKEELEAAKEEINKFKEEAASKSKTINYWADKAIKFEKELKELKHDTDGT